MIFEGAQERAALYALGLLDAGEAGAFEREQDADAGLRALAAELREAAAELARADEEVTVLPAGLKGRVLARVEEEGGRRKAEGGRRKVEPAAGKVVRGPWSGTIPWSLVAVLLLYCGMVWLKEIEGQWGEEGMKRRMQMFETALAHMKAATQPPPSETPMDALRQVVFCPLEETRDETPKPRAAVLWDAARREGVLRVEKLPPPGAGKDYQLWAVEAGHKDTVNAGVVALGEGGSVEVRFAPVAEGGKDQVLAFAISVERAGGSPKNEGPVVFLGKL